MYKYATVCSEANDYAPNSGFYLITKSNSNYSSLKKCWR